MSRSGAAPRAAASATGARPRAASPVSNARAEASRRNGAKSRGPKTPEGKARSAQNALKHGLRAQKYLLLPQEDAAAFQALETALVAELAPEGALQLALARRIAVAAWRLARADRMEAELLEFRSYDGANPGLALIRDGNATRSCNTLMRYRSAAMAEFTRALGTLKALQAEQAEEHATGPQVAEVAPKRPGAPARVASRSASNEPEPAAARSNISDCRLPDAPERRSGSSCERRVEPVVPKLSTPGRSLLEPAASRTPNEPDAARPGASAPVSRGLVPHEPDSRRNPRVREPERGQSEPGRPAPSGHRSELESGPASRGGVSAGAI